MSRRAGEVRCHAGPPPAPRTSPIVSLRGCRGTDVVGAHRPAERGSLTLEAVLVLPILALLAVGLLQVAVVVSDVLLLHEAARAGARTAATTTGADPVVRAARAAAPELDGLVVDVRPVVRRDGDLAHVEVTLERRIGPMTHTLRARAVSRVEPAVGTPRRDAWP